MNGITQPAGTDRRIEHPQTDVARLNRIAELGIAVARWWAKGPPANQPG